MASAVPQIRLRVSAARLPPSEARAPLVGPFLAPTPCPLLMPCSHRIGRCAAPPWTRHTSPRVPSRHSPPRSIARNSRDPAAPRRLPGRIALCAPTLADPWARGASRTPRESCGVVRRLPTARLQPPAIVSPPGGHAAQSLLSDTLRGSTHPGDRPLARRQYSHARPELMTGRAAEAIPSLPSPPSRACNP